MTDSVIETIEKMHEILIRQEGEIKMLRKDVALMGQKVNGVLFPGASAPPQPTISAKAPTIKTLDKDLEKAQKTIGVPLKPSGKTVVFGHVKGKEGKAVSGVEVKITNSSGQQVKVTKTNMAGKWMAHLSPSRYSIKYSHSSMPPSYRLANVEAGQVELEVI
jgi:hypothetical protein